MTLFPAYEEYAKRVPLLWPRAARRRANGVCFRWQLYLRNQEYQALLGFLAGAALLAWKVYR